MTRAILFGLGTGLGITLYNYLFFTNFFWKRPFFQANKIIYLTPIYVSFLIEAFLIGKVRFYLLGKSWILKDSAEDSVFIVLSLLIWTGSFFWFVTIRMLKKRF